MKKHFFTITELVVAMGVFGLLSVFTLHIFSGVQKAWSQNMEKAETDESARVALDLITDELKNIVDLNAYDMTLDSTQQKKYFVFYLPIIPDIARICPQCGAETTYDNSTNKYKCKNNDCKYKWEGTYASSTMFTYITKISGKIKFSGFCLSGGNVYELYRYNFAWDKDDDDVKKYPFMEIDQDRDGSEIAIPTSKEDTNYQSYISSKYLKQEETKTEHRKSGSFGNFCG